MAEVVKNEEKIFKHFLELKPSLRMRMIDKMDTADRCRLTRCSKLCNQEAKASKNYIYELRFFYPSEDDMEIEVKFQQFGFYGYHLWVFKRSEKKLMTYMSLDLRVSWEVELDDSADIFQYAFEEFRKILQSYQNVLKVLQLIDSSGQTVVRTFDYGIESLNSLEHLQVRGSFDAVQLLSKIPHPLKTLSIEGEDNEGLINCEQLYQVRDELTLWTVQLRNEHFERLSVKYLSMGLGNMTEKDIFKFIRSWQDGTLGKEIAMYFLWFDEACFDKNKLFRLLRVGDQGENRIIELKHFKEHGKTARLSRSHDPMMRFYDSKLMRIFDLL